MPTPEAFRRAAAELEWLARRLGCEPGGVGVQQSVRPVDGAKRHGWLAQVRSPDGRRAGRLVQDVEE
jgi:hypothetical protein